MCYGGVVFGGGIFFLFFAAGKSLALAVNSAWPNPARGGKVDDGGTRDGAMSAVTEC